MNAKEIALKRYNEIKRSELVCEEEERELKRRRKEIVESEHEYLRDMFDAFGEVASVDTYYDSRGRAEGLTVTHKDGRTFCIGVMNNTHKYRIGLDAWVEEDVMAKRFASWLLRSQVTK